MSRAELITRLFVMLGVGFYFGASAPDTLAWGGFAIIVMLASLAANAWVSLKPRRRRD